MSEPAAAAEPGNPSKTGISQSEMLIPLVRNKKIALWVAYFSVSLLAPFVMTYLANHYKSGMQDAAAFGPPRRLAEEVAREAEEAAQEAARRPRIEALLGLAYRLNVPLLRDWSDAFPPYNSPALMCEDGRALGPAHTNHGVIAHLGGGRFSHWDRFVIFSTSDGSDPRTNSRRYWLSLDGGCSVTREGAPEAAAFAPARRLAEEVAREAEEAAQEAARRPRIEALLGLAYRLNVPLLRDLSDAFPPYDSPVLMCEDGRALGPAHTSHGVVAHLGGGRFSHWDRYVVFSTSDGSDPRTNSRRYWLSLDGECHLTREAALEAAAFAPAGQLAEEVAREAEEAAREAARQPRIEHVLGLAYRLNVPLLRDLSDAFPPYNSTALMCEDGRALGPAHISHPVVAHLGGGRFSHWDRYVVFSTSDDSDPRTNSRRYWLSLDGECHLTREVALEAAAFAPARRLAEEVAREADEAAQEAAQRPRIEHVLGLAYRLNVPLLRGLSDAVPPYNSTVLMCEDGRALGPAHTSHPVVAHLGGGRFSHWDRYVVFSTSDDSDPRTNSRRYWLSLNGECHLTREAALEAAAFAPARQLAEEVAREADEAAQEAAQRPRIEHVLGLAHRLNVPLLRHLSDPFPPHNSTVLICEDDRALGPAHSSPGLIAHLGGGRFSHWESHVLFSTSDGSDPRSNSRRYWLSLDGRC